MPRDANGNYTLPAGNPVVTGTVITSSWANPTMSDIAQELTNSLSRDGQGGMLVPLFFADGTVNDPSVAFTLESGLGFYRKGAGLFSIAGQGVDLAEFDAGNALALFKGQARVSDAEPDDDADLTRKDYVDALVTGNFAKYLAGYAATGLHIRYADDADLILNNSGYNVAASTLVNKPTDFNSGFGTLVTMMYISTTTGTQILYGMVGTPSQTYKIWMRDRASSAWGEWKLVVDGGAFTERLAGYDDTGFHAGISDCDAPAINSVYVTDNPVTNAPSDFNQADRGYLYTMFNGTADFGCQLLVGRANDNQYKQWMRQVVSGVWGAWKLVVDGGAFTLRLAGYGDDGLHISYLGDLNDITVNSQYKIANGNTSNNPSDFINQGFLMTMLRFSNEVTQILYGQAAGDEYKVWMRQQVAGVWGAWKIVVDGGAFTQRYVGYDDTGRHSLFTGDLDDITFNSTYNITTVVLNDPPDMVTGGHITTMVQNSDSSRINQVLYGLGVDDEYKIWMRQRFGAVWGAWKLVVDGGATSTGTVIQGYQASQSGYLICDGSAIPAQYTALIALVGANTPDLRGQFIRGWSADNSVDPDGPRAAGDGQADAFKSHQHALDRFESGAAGPSYVQIDNDDSETPSQLDIPTGLTGGDETRPVNVALNYFIKT